MKAKYIGRSLNLAMSLTIGKSYNVRRINMNLAKIQVRNDDMILRFYKINGFIIIEDKES